MQRNDPTQPKYDYTCARCGHSYMGKPFAKVRGKPVCSNTCSNARAREMQTK